MVTPGLSAPSRMHTAPVLVRGSAVEADVAATTTTLTTTLAMASPPPLDDGGSQLLGYIVESRHAGAQMHGAWVVVGSVPEKRDEFGRVAVTVHHLSPGCTYQFRLTAYNAIGAAALPGTPSQPFPTGELQGAFGSGGRHVLGHGARTCGPFCARVPISTM
jgi:hypothetical protein